MTATNASQPAEGARLHYSGMTHATTDDGTPATAHGLAGSAPTGHESVSARSMFGSDEDHDGVDLLHRMQPGIAATDGVGAARQKVKEPGRRFRFRREKTNDPAVPARVDGDDDTPPAGWDQLTD